MRKIKFRAWDKKNKLMITYFEITSQGVVKKPTGLGLINENIILDVILMQFTGLTDKNGVEIYESDITNSNWGYKGIVDFNEFIYAKCECTISDDIEVIGNIYQNNELLND